MNTLNGGHILKLETHGYLRYAVGPLVEKVVEVLQIPDPVRGIRQDFCFKVKAYFVSEDLY